MLGAKGCGYDYTADARLCKFNREKQNKMLVATSHFVCAQQFVV